MYSPYRKKKKNAKMKMKKPFLPTAKMICLSIYDGNSSWPKRRRKDRNWRDKNHARMSDCTLLQKKPTLLMSLMK